MEPVANKSTKILFAMFFVLVVGSIAVTYYRYMIREDFTVTTEGQ